MYLFYIDNRVGFKSTPIMLHNYEKYHLHELNGKCQDRVHTFSNVTLPRWIINEHIDT